MKVFSSEGFFCDAAYTARYCSNVWVRVVTFQIWKLFQDQFFNFLWAVYDTVLDGSNFWVCGVAIT